MIKRHSRPNAMRWLVFNLAFVMVLAACGSTEGDESTTSSDSQAPATTAEGGGSTEAPTTTAAGEARGPLTVVMGVGAFESLDPHVAVSPPTNSITDGLYERLVVVGDDNSIQPMLATSWERTDDQTVVFELRDDATFSDGSAVDAAAVVATIQRLIDPANEFTRAGRFSDVESVEVLGETTVQFNLSAPFPNIFYNLATSAGSIINPAAITGGVDLNSASAGSGRFVLDEVAADGSITLAKNENYWGDPTNVDSLEFRAVADEATRVSMLRAGEAHIVANLPATLFDEIEGEAGVDVEIFPSNRVMHIGFNLGKAPLENPLVRQAMNHAVDKQAIVDVITMGLGVPANSYLAPTVPGFVETEGYPYDPERAKELLTEAGVELPLQLTLRYPEGRYFAGKEVSEAVQAYLQAVGIEAELVPMEFNTLLDAFRIPNSEGNEFELYFLGFEAFTGEPGGVTELVMHSDSVPPNGWNTMFYVRDEVDKLIDEASGTVDIDTRNSIYADVQRLISEDPPWLFLYTASSAWGVSADVGTMDVLPDDQLATNQLRWAG